MRSFLMVYISLIKVKSSKLTEQAVFLQTDTLSTCASFSLKVHITAPSPWPSI